MSWGAKILAQIKDPVWWFNAVFVAIAVAILLGVGKWVGTRLLVRVSDSFAARRRAQRQRMTEQAIAIAADSNLLIIAFFRATWWGLGTVSTLVLMVVVTGSVPFSLMTRPWTGYLNLGVAFISWGQFIHIARRTHSAIEIALMAAICYRCRKEASDRTQCQPGCSSPAPTPPVSSGS